MNHLECQQQLRDQKERLSISIRTSTVSKDGIIKGHKPWFVIRVYHKAEPYKTISSTQWQRCCAYAAKAEALRDFEENYDQRILKPVFNQPTS